jgi:hypothetical protein
MTPPRPPIDETPLAKRPSPADDKVALLALVRAMAVAQARQDHLLK